MGSENSKCSKCNEDISIKYRVQSIGDGETVCAGCFFVEHMKTQKKNVSVPESESLKPDSDIVIEDSQN